MALAPRRRRPAKYPPFASMVDPVMEDGAGTYPEVVRPGESIDVIWLHENRDELGHFMLLERFRSQAAIDSYFASEHLATISSAVAHLADVGKPKVAYLRVLTD
jgi:hypothetical protein